MPTRLWDEAVLYTCQILNATTVQKDTGKSAFEIFHKRKPFFGKLFPFGTTVYFLDQNPNLKKLQPRGRPGILVGLNAGIFGYRVWEKGTRRIVVTKHVTFSKRSPLLTREAARREESERGDIFQPKEVNNAPNNSTTEIDTVRQNNGLEQSKNSTNRSESPDLEDQGQMSQLQPTLTTTDSSAATPSNQPSTSSGAISKIKSKKPNLAPTRSSMVLRDRSKLKPPVRYVGLAETHVSKNDNVAIPETYSRAMNSPQKDNWFAAIQAELSNMDKLRVWVPHELPAGKKALDSRWLFKIKRPDPAKPTEVIYKARLCIRGFRQQYGVDYENTYAPTCRFEVIRLMLSIAVKESLCLFQADVACAFLRAPIDREIFIERPEGYQSESSHFKLVSSVYGMKQSPRCFYRKMKEVLASLDFTPTGVDPCVFIGPREHRQILILYVDDSILMSRTEEAAVAFLEKLGQKLEIKYRPLNCFLGIEIETLPHGLFLHQTKYVNDLLNKYDMTNCREAKSPLDRSIYQPDDTQRIDDREYRQLIGSLNFLVSTVRVDLAFSISWLSRFLDKPTEKTWTLALRVLRYLKRTAGYGIMYSRYADQSYHFHSDADFGSCPLTRRSVTGMVIHSGGGCILWKSSLQKSTTLSSCEAELSALSALAQTSQFIRRLLKSLGITITPSLSCDNLASITLATSENQLFARSKHISMKEFYVRELVEAGTITVKHVSSANNLADLLTKPHNSVVFCKLLTLVNFGPIPVFNEHPTAGGVSRPVAPREPQSGDETGE